MFTHKKLANGHSPGKNASRKVTVRPSLSATAPDHCHRAANHLNTGTERPCHGTTAINIPEKDRRIKTPPQRESSSPANAKAMLRVSACSATASNCPLSSQLRKLTHLIDDMIKYLPGQFHTLNDRITSLRDGDPSHLVTATVSTRQGAAPKEKAATFHVYTQAGEKPACDEEVAKMRMSFSKYALFVDAPEGRVHVYGRPCKLSPLQFALTVDRLKNFWRSADIDDVVHWAWTENGLGRNPKDSVTALRSACHDLNRNIGRPRLIFLQVVDRRVKWRTHFPFCLITEKNRINTNQQEIMATDRE